MDRLIEKVLRYIDDNANVMVEDIAEDYSLQTDDDVYEGVIDWIIATVEGEVSSSNIADLLQYIDQDLLNQSLYISNPWTGRSETPSTLSNAIVQLLRVGIYEVIVDRDLVEKWTSRVSQELGVEAV